jgi:hypothetical protein
MSMPTAEGAAEMQVSTEVGSAPGQMSRRSVLRGAAGAGAAGLAATALAGTPALAASRALKPATPKLQRSAEPTAAELAVSEPVVVHVRDLRTGQMDVYRGTSHVRIHNRQLAAQLARASQ